jgi:hypothetical protein
VPDGTPKNPRIEDADRTSQTVVSPDTPQPTSQIDNPRAFLGQSLDHTSTGITLTTNAGTYTPTMVFNTDVPPTETKFPTEKQFMDVSLPANQTHRYRYRIARDRDRGKASLRGAILVQNTDSSQDVDFSQRLASMYADIGVKHVSVWQRWGATEFNGNQISDGAIAFSPLNADADMYKRLVYNANVTYQQMLQDSGTPTTTSEYPGPLLQSEAVTRDGFRIWIFYFHPIRTHTTLKYVQTKSDETGAATQKSRLFTLENMQGHVVRLSSASGPQLTLTSLKELAPVLHASDETRVGVDDDSDGDIDDDDSGGGGGGGSKEKEGAGRRFGLGRRIRQARDQGEESSDEPDLPADPPSDDSYSGIILPAYVTLSANTANFKDATTFNSKHVQNIHLMEWAAIY